MIWVAPYAVADSEKALGAANVQGALTDMALQFWVPTTTGQAVLTDSSPQVTDVAVVRLRDWAHARGIRAVLCVFNGVGSWDWTLAKAGFADHQDEFIGSLTSEMERYQLDGIDVDLEGPGQYESDEPAYVAFVTKLAKAVHARHKRLTVDSFCYKWNAPNRGWWLDLFPAVDAVTAMGYAETGMSSKDWRSYTSMKQAAASFAQKLQIGVPSSVDQWQGNSALEQLTWIQKEGDLGVGIWDARLRAPSWNSPNLWAILNSIR
jgi:hypothetical protein